MRASLPPLLATLALVGAVFASAAPRKQAAPSRLEVLRAGETASRLRVFGQPGDPKLENAEVTAVVRALDGALVDFFRSRAFLPTVDQLGTTTDIDGLWEITPVVHVFSTNGTVPLRAAKVQAVAGGVQAVGTIKIGGAELRVETTYRLDPAAPRLELATEYRVLSGAPPRDLGIGHTVRWGNVPYVVEGVASAKGYFAGRARWIGRRGAGGDLVLRSESDMWLKYATRISGFRGAILALDRPALGAEPYRFTRELAFESLPAPPPAPPRARPGRVIVRVRDERGHPIPAKLRIDRVGSTEPLFPETGGLDGADRFAWTGNGQLECEVPPGKYRALLTSGMERAAQRFKFEIEPGETQVLKAELARVVPTPGWISGDLHLHQAPSVDADISLENRVVSIAAEGLEFAVATDHYAVTDLSPIVATLRREGILSVPVATMIGSEISTLGNRFGHFNVFPLDLADEIRYRDVTPSELFADARRASPRGVIQVNHPRWDDKLGYFTRYGVSFDTAEPKEPGFDPGFDALEVYNGDDARDVNLILPVFLDWLHLLGRGHRYTATGSSDSHNLAYLDPGVPRTYIRHGAGHDDESDVSAPADRIVEALKAGRAIVTSGPFIEASVDGKGPGETARGVGSKARVEVTVRAAPWISAAKLEIYEGGNGRLVHNARLRPSQDPVRFRGALELPLNKATFIVVVVRGDVPLPNVSRDSTLPFAFTNPIWLEP